MLAFGCGRSPACHPSSPSTSATRAVPHRARSRGGPVGAPGGPTGLIVTEFAQGEADAHALDRAFDRRGVAHELRIRQGGHSWTLWSDAFKDWLLVLGDRYRQAPTTKCKVRGNLLQTKIMKTKSKKQFSREI